jgi:hypothetical protein
VSVFLNVDEPALPPKWFASVDSQIPQLIDTSNHAIN